MIVSERWPLGCIRIRRTTDVAGFHFCLSVLMGKLSHGFGLTHLGSTWVQSVRTSVASIERRVI